jgi:hypothetical protein
MPVDLSITRLEELIARGQSQFRYKIYPEYGHELIVFDFSRASLSLPFSDGVDWIKKTAGGAARSALPPSVATESLMRPRPSTNVSTDQRRSGH